MTLRAKRLGPLVLRAIPAGRAGLIDREPGHGHLLFRVGGKIDVVKCRKFSRCLAEVFFQ